MTAPLGGAPTGFPALAAEKADADNQAVGKTWGTRLLQPLMPPNLASNHLEPAHTWCCHRLPQQSRTERTDI